MIIDCQKIANEIKTELKEKVDQIWKLHEYGPFIVIVQVGNNQASNSYIKGKTKDCDEVGMEWYIAKLPETVTTDELVATVKDWNDRKCVDGIIVQLPLPDHIDKNRVMNVISDDKDIDGFKSSSKFTPCTPKGVMTVFEKMNIDLTGKVCTVIGKSDIVGRPLVNLLMTAGATVISCNSKTKDLKSHTLRSDIVISAVGKRDLVTKDMVTEDTIVIDIGINRDENGKLCGDVSRECYDYVNMITPVPKGIGLMTRAALLENLYDAYIVKTEPYKKLSAYVEFLEKEIPRTLDRVNELMYGSGEDIRVIENASTITGNVVLGNAKLGE